MEKRAAPAWAGAVGAGVRYAFLPPSPSAVLAPVDELAREFFASLDDEQREQVCVPYDHPLRQYHNRGVAGGGLGILPGMSIAEAEKRLIQATLERLDGDKKEASRQLGISLKTLYNRLNRYEAEDAGRRAAGGDSKAGGA